jgi:YVTN family beta-propeller protein
MIVGLLLGPLTVTSAVGYYPCLAAPSSPPQSPHLNFPNLASAVHRALLHGFPSTMPVVGLAHGSPKGHRLTASIQNLRVGWGPEGIGYDGRDNELFVANELGNSVSVISGSSNTVVATIAGVLTPSGVAYDNRTQKLYASACNFGQEVVSLISPENLSSNNNSEQPWIPSGGIDACAAVYDSGKGEIFVMRSGGLSVISDRTNSIVANISMRDSTISGAMAYDSRDGKILVADDFSGNLSIISDSSNAIVHTVRIGTGDVAFGTTPSAVAYDAAKNEAFVANFGSGFYNVSVVNLSTYSIVATVPVAPSPLGLSYDSKDGEILVCNYWSNNVSVISDTINKVIEGIPVGNHPTSIVYDSADGYTYVTDEKDNNVTVIAPQTSFPEKVTFVQTGLDPGTEWSVTLNGVSKASTSNALEFIEGQGTYLFQVSPIAGYSESPASGTISVGYAPLAEQLSFAKAVPWSQDPNFALYSMTLTQADQCALAVSATILVGPLAGSILCSSSLTSAGIVVDLLLPSSSAGGPEFTASLSTELGISAPSGYTPVAALLLDLPFLSDVNGIFGSQIGAQQYTLGISGITSIPGYDASIESTPNGDIVIAFTLSLPSSVPWAAEASSLAAAMGLLGAAIVKGDASQLAQVVEETLISITGLGDVTMSAITTDLTTSGKLSSHPVFDLSALAAFLNPGGGVTVTDRLLQSAQLAVTCMVAMGLDASALPTAGASALLAVPKDLQCAIGGVDMAIDLLPQVAAFSSLASDSLYLTIKGGVDAFTALVDPDNSTALPAVYSSNGTYLLGFDVSSRTFKYQSTFGFILSANGSYWIHLSESSPSPVNYQVRLEPVGPPNYLPYTFRAWKTDDSGVSPDLYSGITVPGYSTRFYLNLSASKSLQPQVYLLPISVVKQAGSIIDVRVQAHLSDGENVSVSEVFVEIGSRFFPMNRTSTGEFELNVTYESTTAFPLYVYAVSTTYIGGLWISILNRSASDGPSESGSAGLPLWTLAIGSLFVGGIAWVLWGIRRRRASTGARSPTSDSPMSDSGPSGTEPNRRQVPVSEHVDESHGSYGGVESETPVSSSIATSHSVAGNQIRSDSTEHWPQTVPDDEIGPSSQTFPQDSGSVLSGDLVSDDVDQLGHRADKTSTIVGPPEKLIRELNHLRLITPEEADLALLRLPASIRISAGMLPSVIEFRRLAALRRSGVLSEQEYHDKRTDLLTRIIEA